MVSGFFTSPCDHLRISSAVARPMRISSKKFTSSILCLSLFSQLTRYLKFSVTEPSPPPTCQKLSTIFGAEILTSRRESGALDFFDSAEGVTGATGEVDAEVFRRPVVVLGVSQFHLCAVTGQHFNVQA